MEKIAFYFLAGGLFLTLIYRGVKPSSQNQRLTFYLFALLYFAIFLYSFFWVQTPPVWLRGFNFFLFAAGEILFLSDPLGKFFHKKWGMNLSLKDLKKEKGGLYEVIMGAHLLSQARLGALIAIERKQSLKTWGDKGIQVDATLSREILYSIFTPPGALHDGGAIINQKRVTACSVIFPLTQTANFPKELGTRHRAALGFSEVTDALCLVVSEESGTVSIADRGWLYYDISFEKLPKILEQALRFRLKNKKDKSLVQTWELAKV